MKLALPLLATLVLASCAPTTLQGLGGRIVNVRTGQEGRINFVGGFQDRATLPTDPDNVTVTLGGTVYSGRYTVLGTASPRLGISLGFGGGYSSGPGGFFGTRGAFGSFGRPVASNPTRPGNLIAKTAPTQGGAVQTLTCTFDTDSSQHGIGTCQDSAGGSYSLQF